MHNDHRPCEPHSQRGGERVMVIARWVTVTLVLVLTGLAAPSAQAAARDGFCQRGEFCLYYNSDLQGSISDFDGSIPNYGSTQPMCYEFRGAGAGQRLCVKNRAASAWNRTSGQVTVYFNSGYQGANQAVASRAQVNLNTTLKNNNASHKFETSGTGGPNNGSAPPPSSRQQPPPPPPVDRAEQRRFAIETMKLSWQAFFARKLHFLANNCSKGPVGCRKPVPINAYDWTHDGCSGPQWSQRFTKQFRLACLQHDFGYRNFGNGLRLGRNELRRVWIDRRMLKEMQSLCWHHYPRRFRDARLRAGCLITARRVYEAVRIGGRGAFYS